MLLRRSDSEWLINRGNVLLWVSHWHKYVIVIDAVVVDEDWGLLTHIFIKWVNPHVGCFAWIDWAISVSWVGTLHDWSFQNFRHGSEGGPVRPGWVRASSASFLLDVGFEFVTSQASLLQEVREFTCSVSLLLDVVTNFLSKLIVHCFSSKWFLFASSDAYRDSREEAISVTADWDKPGTFISEISTQVVSQGSKVVLACQPLANGLLLLIGHEGVVRVGLVVCAHPLILIVWLGFFIVFRFSRDDLDFWLVFRFHEFLDSCIECFSNLIFDGLLFLHFV